MAAKRKRFVLFALLCCSAWPLRAHARVERFAVIVANDRGASGETPLRYAQADATRVQQVLRDLGGFEPVNSVLLHNENAETVRSTLIAVNDRIRELVAQPDTQVFLFVYYSGHADAENLHLGDSALPVRELTQLARGSAANFRLLVLDACRSGAITRVKGGHIVAPFPIVEDATLPNDGLAFLTASSANEDAQESDELRGSFFTHAFVSGLLGAADRDGDGAVVLEEAYRYAYQATLRATSRTFAGTQHPSFRYDFHGQGELVLTQPRAHANERASLLFPSDLNILLMQSDAGGTVVAELGEHAAARSVSVPPGRYFVRARGRDVLYEGGFDAVAGTSAEVPVRDMTRVEYAHLVRKGGRDSGFSHGPELGVRVRTALSNSQTACIGAVVGYGLDWAHFGAHARLSACTSSFDNGAVQATTNAYDLETRVYHAWDIAPVSFELGLGGGASLFTQDFTSTGRAPATRSLSPFVALGLATVVDIAHGFYAALDLAAETHFLRVRDSRAEAERTQVDFGARVSLLAGKRF